MKLKKLFLGLLATLFALGAMGKPARAQDDNSGLVTLDPGDPLVFNVLAKDDKVKDGFWHVGVYYVNTDTWYVQAFADQGKGTPIVDVTDISLSFYGKRDLTDVGNRLNLSGAVGGNINTPGPDQPGILPVPGLPYLWSPIKPQHYTTAVNWSTATGHDAGGLQDLRTDDKDIFSATIHVGKNGQEAVKGFTIGLANSNYDWQASAVTPEAASLALLLPGLLPIGFAVRRRRANRA